MGNIRVAKTHQGGCACIQRLYGSLTVRVSLNIFEAGCFLSVPLLTMSLPVMFEHLVAFAFPNLYAPLALRCQASCSLTQSGRLSASRRHGARATLTLRPGALF